MKTALVVGGNSGIGLSVSISLWKKGYEKIYIVGKEAINAQDVPGSIREAFMGVVEERVVNLVSEDYSCFDDIKFIDALVITAGFGRVCPFESLNEIEISNLIKCNELSAIQIIKRYYSQIRDRENFYTLVMSSIAGHISSPLFSVYAATKAALSRFIESVNVELECDGISNRILDVSAGSIKGTRFNGGENNVETHLAFADVLVEKMLARELLFIPEYETVYKGVIERYRTDAQEYGRHSLEYKKLGGRINNKPQLTVGYLSGTFDLFHVGHVNLLKRAKQYCDYLIVGVHKDASHKGKETFIPYEERVEMLKSCRYVDKVVLSHKEDSEAWKVYKYDRLFVGSDYKGTERFLNYERYFADKGVEILYFPYTQGTSSSKIREKIDKQK